MLSARDANFPERRAGPAAVLGWSADNDEPNPPRRRRIQAGRTVSARGAGAPGGGASPPVERREGRGFQRRGNHAGWTHGSERAAGSGPGQGALLSPGRAHGREPRGTPVFRTEGRRGARRRPTPLGPLSRARCIALLESQPAAAPRVFKQRVGQGRETNKGTYFCSGLPAPERCFRERCAIRLGLRRILLLRPLRKC